MFEEPMITEKRKKHIKILINSTQELPQHSSHF